MLSLCGVMLVALHVMTCAATPLERGHPPGQTSNPKLAAPVRNETQRPTERHEAPDGRGEAPRMRSNHSDPPGKGPAVHREAVNRTPQRNIRLSAYLRLRSFTECMEWLLVFLLVAPGSFPALSCAVLACAAFCRRRLAALAACCRASSRSAASTEGSDVSRGLSSDEELDRFRDFSSTRRRGLTGG